MTSLTITRTVKGNTMKKRMYASLAATGILALALSACGGDPMEDGGGNGDGGDGGDSGAVTIGSANFAESELLAEIYAQALEEADIAVERNFSIGARELYVAALEDGSIDLIPEYVGAFYLYFAGDDVPEDLTGSEEVYEALQEELPDGIVALEQSEAENKSTLTVRSETAEEYGLETIADLEPHAGEFSMAAGPEQAERWQGLIGLEEVYGIEFGDFQGLDAGGPLTVGALLDGDADVANVFSTDPVIEEEDLVVLEDPEGLYLAQNILPVGDEDSITEEVEEQLNAVSAALTTEGLTELLASMQNDRTPLVDAAEEFLSEHGIVD